MTLRRHHHRFWLSMSGWFAIALILVNSVPPLAQAACPDDLQRMGDAYRVCKQKADLCDAALRDSIEVTAALKAENAALKDDVRDYEALKASCKSLDSNYAALNSKSEEINRILKQSLGLSQLSTAELSRALDDLNAKYNSCYRDCMKPWWGRWELYVGLAAGALVVGSAVYALER